MMDAFDVEPLRCSAGRFWAWTVVRALRIVALRCSAIRERLLARGFLVGAL